MRSVLIMAIVVVLVGAASAERLYAPDGAIVDVPDQSVSYALHDGYRRIPHVAMRTPEGEMRFVPEDQVAAALAARWWLMKDDEILDRGAAEPPTPLWNRMGIVFVIGAILGISALLRPWRYFS